MKEERLPHGPEWQLESNIKHHESKAREARNIAQKQSEQAEHHDKMAEAFKHALTKLIQD